MNPENNVDYFYGDNSAIDNRIGKIYAVEDASGRQEFSYGKMGEVLKNIRTFALPNEQNTYTFVMEFAYDSWNRIMSTIYPDGEKLYYFYNRGGLLKRMESDYNGTPYLYIDSINYNKFEKRTFIQYGNGTFADYTYDVLQRLSNLKSYSNTGMMQDINYTFDDNNNILSLINYAGMQSNGLGGIYSHDYSYDNNNRLITSGGTWDNGNTTLNYSLGLQYDNDGKIKQKSLYADVLLNGNLFSTNYSNDYSYYSGQSHTVENVYENNSQLNQKFEWDPNGNLVSHYTEFPESNERHLCWDEENRLMAVKDNNYTSYYIYDNSGERTFKLTGTNSNMNINGNWYSVTQLNNPTLYTSGYVVANNQGYTKHYYAGSERISSAIGLGGLTNIDIPLETSSYGSWEEKISSLGEKLDRTLSECIRIPYSTEYSLENLKSLKDIGSGTMDRYFYHPDHLGSSSWITDNNGYTIQYLHYLPFGEDWVDERNSSWFTPYTFSAKEKDVETGYGYFGARYYDSGLSIWLSVDPMSDKYPTLSPYNYCANNPVILVDPDGLYPIITITNQQTGQTASQRVIGYSNSVTTQVPLYNVVVTDTEDKNFRMTFSVTRDAWTVMAGNSFASNVAFEPKDANVNQYTGKVMPNGYPQGNGTQALKLTQKNSEVVHAESNQTAVEMGYRYDSDVAQGIMLHVGGYYEKSGKIQLAASEGCFGIVNPDNSPSNTSNDYSNSIINSIINQANSSKTNKGKIVIIIQKREGDDFQKTKKIE